MKYNLILLMAGTLASCASPSVPGTDENAAPEPVVTVVELNPAGNFVRLSSPERLPDSTLHHVAVEYLKIYDRVDFCIESTPERGCEYRSAAGCTILDYSTGLIIPLDSLPW